MNLQQMESAKEALIEWLSNPSELGVAPGKIEYMKEFDLYAMHYYVFRFKKDFFSKWILGVCGGYEGDELEHCGHVFSEMQKYVDETAIEESIKMVEIMRAYWMQQAENQENLQALFEKNLKYISQTEIDPNVIAHQFVKSESRYFLQVGVVDLPTGNIIVADPLCYLAQGRMCPQLQITVPIGTYPVEVALCRSQSIGIRMCTARLKITGEKAVRYELAKPTEETAIAKYKDGVLSGFPVEAGMMGFCDVQVAKEYLEFLEKWEQENPGKNHYDDYFAAYFAESEKNFPAYQREGGDFIEWSVPKKGNRLVMIASGFGDGFYQCFWGYDAKNEMCDLIVPMVNPDLFGV